MQSQETLGNWGTQHRRAGYGCGVPGACCALAEEQQWEAQLGGEEDRLWSGRSWVLWG